MENPGQAKLSQLGKRHAAKESQRQRQSSHNERFPQQHPAQVSLSHAENVIQAKLLFPAAHQKRIGVEQENQCEQHHNPGAEAQHLGCGSSARHIVQHTHGSQIMDDVEHHHHAHAGEQIRNIQPLILADAIPRKSGVKSEFHACSPPVASMVSVSEIL